MIVLSVEITFLASAIALEFVLAKYLSNIANKHT